MDVTLGQSLPLIHPGLVGAALAAGLIPILIHLINRRRYRRVSWAAMSFLLAANRRSTRRLRMEQFLLMALRVGIIVVLGLVLARPYFPANALLPVGSSRVHRLILLDNSLSMNARQARGRTRFEAAKAYATSLVDSFPADDAVSLITMSQPAAAVIDHASFDRRFVRERLASIAPSQRSSDVVTAIDTAIRLLKESELPAGNRAVFVISDLPRTLWLGERNDAPTPAMQAVQRLAQAIPRPDRDLTVVRLSREPNGNVAVTRLTVETPLVGAGISFRASVQITNFSPQTASNLTLQLGRDGSILRREPVPRIEARKSHVATITTEFTEPGVHWLEARLAAAGPDALEEDDARYLSLDVRKTAPVLLVDGRPGATALAGDAGYLATALAPAVPAPGDTSRTGRPAEVRISPVETKIISEPELAAEVLSDFDAVVLCNVARVSPEMWRQLARYVERGGGLLITAGEQLNVEEYNRHAHGDVGLLPGRLANVAQAATDADGPLGFKLDRTVHPIAADFVQETSSGLFSARVDRYIPIEVDARRAEVVLRLTNDAPALVLAGRGKGAAAYFATTVNMEWTNLPSKGDFVSLFSSLLAHISARHGRHRTLTVGQVAREPLSARQSSLPLRVTNVDATSAEMLIRSEGEALFAQIGPLDSAGVVFLWIGPQKLPFAVNVDASESDLNEATDREWTEALGRPVRMMSDAAEVRTHAEEDRATEIATPLLYCLVLMLLVETLLAMWFGAPRGEAA